MNTLIHADYFFVISSIGFIILFVIAAVAAFYTIKAIRSFTSLMEKIEDNVDSVGDAGRDLIDDMKNSIAFKLLFKGKKNNRK